MPDARTSWWIVPGAILIACLYLPSLSTPFDFIDDGNLVYAAPPMPLPERIQLYWDKVVANYEHLGPFRPTLWIHWEIEAELFDGSPLAWRTARLCWCGLAASMLLWLMREFGIPPIAALMAACVTMANPYRNEIWTSLTLSEGVAMPYALLALSCALRAGRSPRPWMWDLLGVFCVLVALGCKNTFIALIPAQCLLRIAPDGRGWREGLRRNGPRAALMSLTVLLPLAHYIYFKLHWHPGQYSPGRPSFDYFLKFIKALSGAMSVDFLAIGLILSGIAFLAGRTVEKPNRGLVLAALALLIGGIGVYLPLGAISGRYTMPAVWGIDLLFAAWLGALVATPSTLWKRLAWGGFAVGLIAIAAASVGKQEKFAARARMLWQVLEQVESTAPPGARIAWIAGPDLNIEEGIHFQWHLQARGRGNLRLDVFDSEGQVQSRVELGDDPGPAIIAVTATDSLPTFLAGNWQPQEFHVPYWRGRRQFECWLWRRN